MLVGTLFGKFEGFKVGIKVCNFVGKNVGMLVVVTPMIG
jgi:hypothetical protein